MKNRQFVMTPLAAAIGGILAGTAGTAVAQSADAEDEPRIEEITVTASRREQNILDVPYNISAISGEDIEAAFTLDNEELLRSIPGISQIDQGPRNGAQFSSIRIRGLNVDSSALGDYAVPSVATVSTYVNETPVYANLALTDLERVEVLRGPQGTLYGSGALGGTIKYFLRQPQLGEMDGGLVTEFSNVEGSDSTGYGVQGTLNIPFGESSALRANVYLRDYPGITDYINLYELDDNGVPVQPNGIFARGPDSTNYRSVEDMDTFESLYGRVAYRWQPSDGFDMTLTYVYQDDDIGGRRQLTQGEDGLGNDYPGYSNGAVIGEPSDREFNMGSLEMNVDFGFATLTSATSYYDNKGGSESDNTGFYANNFAFYYYFYPRPLYTAERGFNDRALVQELRLVSSGERNVDYVVGAFYREQNLGVSQVSDLVGFEAWADAVPLFLTVSTDNVFTFQRDEDFTDIAVFGEVTWHATDRLHLTGGLRWFDVESDVNTFVRTGAYDFIADSVSTPFKNSEDDVLFKANLAYDIGDDDLMFVTVSEGFRRGGNNGVPTIGRFANDPGWLIYESDSVTNYEIGFKGIANNVRYDLSAFHIDWENPQFNTSAPVGSYFAVVNGDEARTSGLEVQLSGAFNDKFGYALGYAYVDAELSEDLFEPVNINTGSETLVASEGAPLPGIPEHAVNIAADYTTPVGANGAMTLRLDGFYQSSTQNVLDEGILQSEEFPAFWVWDASAAWYNDNWTVALFVKNIANEDGTTGAFTSDAFGPVVDPVNPFLSAEFYGSNARQFIVLPRTIGLSIRYDF